MVYDIPSGLAASRGEPSSLGTGYRLPNEPGATLRLPPAVNRRPFRASRGEEDGTKGHKRQRDTLAVLCTRRRSAHADEKWRCAHFEQATRLCDSWKNTYSPSHASYQRSVGILGGETAKQYLPSVRVARRNKR